MLLSESRGYTKQESERERERHCVTTAATSVAPASVLKRAAAESRRVVVAVAVTRSVVAPAPRSAAEKERLFAEPSKNSRLKHQEIDHVRTD